MVLALGVSSVLMFLIKTTWTGGILAHETDVVFLDDTNGLSYSQWNVKLCEPNENSSLYSSVYIVSNNNVTLRTRQRRVVSGTLHQQQHSRSSGQLPMPLYLWKGSTITYVICISTSINQAQENGTLYIFDNQGIYEKFLNYEQDGSGAVYQHMVEVGSNNQAKCTETSVLWSVTSYLFLTVETPANVTYQFNVTSEQLYVENDFLEACFVTNDLSCTINIPHTSLEYLLLAYVYPSHHSKAQPLNTHYCVEAKQPFLVPLMLGSVASAVLCFAGLAGVVYVINTLYSSSGISKRFQEVSSHIQ